jgi:hypothetical protein
VPTELRESSLREGSQMSTLMPLVPSARSANSPIHPTYLPFDREVFRRHFARAGGNPLPDSHLRYYEESARRALKHRCPSRRGAGGSLRVCPPLAHQIEKDERFWIATALMQIFHRPDRASALTRLLTECLGAVPPVNGLNAWDDALDDVTKLELYFEVNLPAPVSYKAWMQENYEERVLTPRLQARALQNIGQLEGTTKADAMLIAPGTGFAVVFEAKVYSDASSHTTYDAKRNQIARNIDVLLDFHHNTKFPLDQRQPARSCFVLVTPELFKHDPTSRLYGSLMHAYRRDNELLQAHLRHRESSALAGIPERLGWVSWERIEELTPGACPWLSK